MRHLSATPRPALAPFVSAVFWFEADFAHQRELALPHGGTQLTVNLAEDEQRFYDEPGSVAPHRLPAAVLTGPATRPACIDTDEQREVVGVCFHPGGAQSFFGVPATETTDERVPLEALWGADGASLRERLMHCPDPAAQLRTVQDLLLARAGRLDHDPLVRYAAAALERGVRVATLADHLGVTPRHLARRFGAGVGYRPKHFARIRRFQRLLAAVTGAPRSGRPAPPGRTATGPRDEGRDWATLAARFGYSDQSHLIHEFREFAGVTPGAYRPRSAAERNHLPVSHFSNTRAVDGGTIGAWTTH